MNLTEAIIEAQSCFNSPPPNESCTCDWVIYPLLLACGYARRDIVSRVADNNGQFPDYTLLPDNSHTWYVEAKDWNKRIEDNHALQSLNYANHNGKRFVVLTNGQVWRLYDNAIQGIVGDKMIAEAQLTDTTEILAFLGLVEKTEVVSGRLASSAVKARLRSLIVKQIFDPASDIVGAIRTAIRRDTTMLRIKNEDIVSCLREILASKSEPVAVTDASPSSPPTSSLPSKTKLKIVPTTGMTNLQELADRIRKEGYQVVAGTKPSQAIFPDGSQWSGGSWAKFAEVVVRWIGEKHHLPELPYMGAGHGTNYFLHTEPMHGDNRRMKLARQLQIGDKVLFVFTNMSANQFVYRLCELCRVADVAPSAIHLSLS
jgi:hypothetical protein